MKPALTACWLALLFVVLASVAGCATTDSENVAERPWNAPKNWEYGLPPSMLEGR